MRDFHFRVLNGRVQGDSTGEYTWQRGTRKSTLDYAIVSWEAKADMHVVTELLDASDHAALSV